MPTPPSVRVIVRLPFNRPEDAPPNPPRIEWNAEKEHILWEVIAKSHAIEGANPDWKGLAAHLQVPLPYLFYRTQARYEEDLRGLQGLGLRTPSSVFPPSAPSPSRANVPGEYFPRIADPNRPLPSHRDSTHVRLGSSSSATGGMSSTSGTVPSTSTLRLNIGVRARLSSLGHAHGRALAQLRSPTGADHVQSPLSANATGFPNSKPAKKISSSSTITLQGPKKTRSPQLEPLSPASSRAGSSSDCADEGEDMSDEDESDEEARREEETEKQESLARKLRDLERLITKDALGLVRDPATLSSSRVNGNAAGLGVKPRGRPRLLSGASASLSSSSAPRSYSRSRSQSHQSLSSASVDSPQDSIPSIPSPPPQSHHYTHQYPSTHTDARHHSQGHNGYPSPNLDHHPTHSYSQSQSASSHSLSQSRSNPNSNPQSPLRVSSPMPMARHLGTPEKSSSPPALSSGSARGHTTNARTSHRAASGPVAGTPTTGSEASSFSDLSDASVSQSALESALMSNIKGGGSRLSSFARSKRSTRS